MMRCCSAAVPSAGARNSTLIPEISFSAFSVPFRAMTQKSDVLLGTKASLCGPPVLLVPPVLFVGEDAGWQLLTSRMESSTQARLSSERVAFTGRIGFLGCWVFGVTLLSTFRAKKGTQIKSTAGVGFQGMHVRGRYTGRRVRAGRRARRVRCLRLVSTAQPRPPAASDSCAEKYARRSPRSRSGQRADHGNARWRSRDSEGRSVSVRVCRGRCRSQRVSSNRYRHHTSRVHESRQSPLEGGTW